MLLDPIEAVIGRPPVLVILLVVVVMTGWPQVAFALIGGFISRWSKTSPNHSTLTSSMRGTAKFPVPTHPTSSGSRAARRRDRTGGRSRCCKTVSPLAA